MVVTIALDRMGLLHGILLAVLGRTPIPIHVNTSSSPGARVSTELFGHDLEFTRHDLFNGISAEMLANRKFATLPPAAPPGWPADMRMLADAGVGGAPRWTGVGRAALDAPYWKNHSGLLSGDVGHSVRCDAGDAPCGVEQGGWLGGFNSGKGFGSSIALEAGKPYVLRLVLRGAGNGSDSVPVSLSSAGAHLWSHTFAVPAASSGWVTVLANITTTETTTNATLRIASASSSAPWYLGTASLSPVDATPQRLRADVVAALKATKFQGPLRYPGGCFATFYRWKVGLLPPDLRPPIATPPSYCAAVPGGVNGYTDGVMTNGLGIDEYISLVRDLGMVPAITVRVVLGTDEEILEARDWVEYVNGNASTRFGALRASRLGHEQPYNVSVWYLGNEIFQARCPAYPSNPSCTGGIGADEYAEMAQKFVRAMKAASPSLPLRLISANPAPSGPWVASIAAETYGWSTHGGYYGKLVNFSAGALTECAKAPRDVFVPQLRANRATLDAAGAPHVAISADEWALGWPWLLDGNFSVAHGIYTAAFLGSITRVAEELTVAFTNDFEPINEGAIFVGTFSSQLTPVGEVMSVMAEHAGGIQAQLSTVDDDLDVLATVHGDTATGDRRVLVTITNLVAHDYLGPKPVAIIIGDASFLPEQTVRVTMLEASGFAQNATFSHATSSVVLAKNGTLHMHVPPFSLLRFTLRLGDSVH